MCVGNGCILRRVGECGVSAGFEQRGFVGLWQPHLIGQNIAANGSIIAVVFDTRGLEIDTIAHEAIHIKNMVYSHSGIKHDLSNDEPEAYLTGWIVGQIYNCYKESKKK